MTYFVLCDSEEFRKTFKAENPLVKAVSVVSYMLICFIFNDDVPFLNMHLNCLLHSLFEGWESWRREMEILVQCCKLCNCDK